MVRLFKLSELHYKDNDLGLGVCNFLNSEHLGLLIKNEGEDLNLYDFLNHKSPLHEGEVGEYYLCKFSNYFDEDLIMTFNNTLSYVLDELKNNDLPFSIIFSEDTLNMNLSQLMESTGLGFTCTTIILRVFNHINLHLISHNSWPVGLDEDKKFQSDIIDNLKKLYPVHAEKQMPFIGKVPRFSPIQVLIAFSIYWGKPISYNEVEPYVQTIREQLHQHDLLIETSE